MDPSLALQTTAKQPKLWLFACLAGWAPPVSNRQNFGGLLTEGACPDTARQRSKLWLFAVVCPASHPIESHQNYGCFRTWDGHHKYGNHHKF